jgi:hypothetical protein
VEAKTFLGRLFHKQIPRVQPPVKQRVLEPLSKRTRAAKEDKEGEQTTLAIGRFVDASWADLEKSLDGCFVRLNQFVRTYVHPTRTMLVENFIRSTGIVCKENEPTADLLIPMAHLPATNARITEGIISVIVVQVKLREKFMGAHQIDGWIDEIADLQYLPKDKPVIAILIEFGPRATAYVDGEFVIRKMLDRPDSFAILCRRLCPADIFDSENLDGPINTAFLNLLESHVDPSKSLNVEASIRAEIKNMFVGPPYGFSTEKWNF